MYHIDISVSSAIIEHTDQVIYLEENDVASVHDGTLNIHQAATSLDLMDKQAPMYREISTLKVAIEQIMKGQIVQSLLALSRFLKMK